MQLESLANELLLDLFEFFDTIQLFRAFTELNSRFNQLLCYHFRVHQLNLQFLSKEDFDNICEKYLPLILDQVISLRLSNNETPILPELFLSRGFTLDRFIRLQSLSLYNIYSLDILDKIIYQCRYLFHFTHLNIIKYYERETHKNIVGLLNNIWSLEKLTYCNLNGIIHADETSLSKISIISSSIEYLSIENIPSNLNSLSHLFKCTPNLQRFCTTLFSYSLNDHLTFSMSSIKTIKFFFGGSLASMENLLEKLPNLSHLMVITSQIYLDGNIWKEFIKNYLPKIKIFQLKMELDFQERDGDMNEIIDELLESFRSSFWIEEHQWYVRCQWSPEDSFKSITLYTLPYAFNTFDTSNTCCTKSTCLDEQQYWSYDSVQIFDHSNMNITLFDSSSLLNTCFPNIHHLNINLRFDDMFWLRFISLNHLKSLNVSVYKYSSYYQLQTLLDQAPCLYSLKIKSFVGLSTELFQLTSKSIKKLDFIDILVDESTYFTKENCLTLINSSLGIQCEVLLIRIKNRSIILDLIEKISNLRLLIFECEDDKESFLNYSYSRNQLISWLQYHLSSTCSIIRDPRKLSRIQIWINREVKKTFSSNIFTLISKNKNKSSKILTLFRQFFS